MKVFLMCLVLTCALFAGPKEDLEKFQDVMNERRISEVGSEKIPSLRKIQKTTASTATYNNAEMNMTYDPPAGWSYTVSLETSTAVWLVATNPFYNVFNEPMEVKIQTWKFTDNLEAKYFARGDCFQTLESAYNVVSNPYPRCAYASDTTYPSGTHFAWESIVWADNQALDIEVRNTVVDNFVYMVYYSTTTDDAIMNGNEYDNHIFALGPYQATLSKPLALTGWRDLIGEQLKVYDVRGRKVMDAHTDRGLINLKDVAAKQMMILNGRVNPNIK